MAEKRNKTPKAPEMVKIGCNRFKTKKGRKVYEVVYNSFCKGWNVIRRDKDSLLYRTVVYKCKTKEEAAEQLLNLNIT